MIGEKWKLWIHGNKEGAREIFYFSIEPSLMQLMGSYTTKRDLSIFGVTSKFKEALYTFTLIYK